MTDHFDYIIAGAGAAGAVLANRLSADPSKTVLLLEYGGSDRHPIHKVPKGFYFTMNARRYSYRYQTEPVGPQQRPESWIRGKVAGGSTTINGMQYIRGSAADYDALASNGNPAWGWNAMLPVFRAMEDHDLGASAMRGVGGPLHVSVTKTGDEVNDAILAASQQIGWKHTPDLNADDNERIGAAPSNTLNGMRVSAASAFLHPVRQRPNLTYLDHTNVGYLLFDGTRVAGVRVRRNGVTRDFFATSEVIAALGTVETPLLLERSGIGDPRILAHAEVAARVESPNVGKRVIEQRAVPLQATLRRDLGYNRLLNSAPRVIWAATKYLAGRGGPISLGPYDLVSFFKSTPCVDRPDVQGMFAPVSLDLSEPGLRVAKHPGLMFMGYAVDPTTHSSVHVSSHLPEAAPTIEARFLETEYDRAVTATILGRVREVLRRPPLADLVHGEEFPGEDVQSAEQVLRHAMDSGGGVYHAVGSAAMGPHDDDVVDPHLRVRGVHGLRVVDASVFPRIVGGNSAAPTMAVAWKTAELITDNPG